jgi:hypothetical protein
VRMPPTIGRPGRRRMTKQCRSSSRAPASNHTMPGAG